MLPRAVFLRALRQSHQPTIRNLRTLARPRIQAPLQTRAASHTPPLVRWLSSKSLADEKIEEITELYATAKDEVRRQTNASPGFYARSAYCVFKQFEMAMEETESNTVYAEEDRKAAREELEKLQEAYRAVVEGPDAELAEEVKNRAGHRIRELENAVKAMEELAMNQD
ncbi:hypothetical protein M8818_007261 [Zalaria obscura]|uniref:Uncharacterized protein n=1 Tax=Zalaria obscura TaxID=2024903 RepID=A0ACC3S4W5_9PEZI